MEKKTIKIEGVERDRDWLTGQMKRCGVPKHLRESLCRYVFSHIRPGGFLTAMLSGLSVLEVVRLADRETVKAIPEVASFFYHCLPCGMYGTAAAVSEHLSQRDLEAA